MSAQSSKIDLAIFRVFVRSQTIDPIDSGYGFTGITYGIYILIAWLLFLLTPIGLLVGFIFCYSIMHLHHAVVDDAYDRVKLVLASARLLMAAAGGESWQLDMDDPRVRYAIDTVRAGAPIQDTINLKKKKGRAGKKERPWRARFLGVALRLRQECRVALKDAFDAVEGQGTEEQKESLREIRKYAGRDRLEIAEAGRQSQAQRIKQRVGKLARLGSSTKVPTRSGANGSSTAQRAKDKLHAE